MSAALLIAAASCVEVGAQPAPIDDSVIVRVRVGEDLDLESLIRLVNDELGLSIIHERPLPGDVNRKIIIWGRTEIPRGALLGLLQATLRDRGLALVDDPLTGKRRIVQLGQVRPYTRQGQAGDAAEAEYLTEVFHLRHLQADRAQTYVRTFFPGFESGAGSTNSMTVVAEANLLVVTDLAINLEKIERLIADVDRPSTEVIHLFREVRHLEAETLKSQLDDIIRSSAAIERGAGGAIRAVEEVNPPVHVSADPRTNRLILIGPKERIDAILPLVDDLDVSLDLTVETYTFRHVAAKRIDELLKQTLDRTHAARIYQGILDDQANRLIVTARPEVHERIRMLRDQLDREEAVPEEQSPVRFYQLKNVKASEVLDTLRSVERTQRSERPSRSEDGTGRLRMRDDWEVPGPNRFDPRSDSGELPVPPAERTRGSDLEPRFPESQLLPDRLDLPRGDVLPGDAQVTVDENTNTLIVVAEPAVQTLYARLIEQLDRRRPQVLIEARVVAVDLDDRKNIGVEISGGDGIGTRKVFAFSSHGLSTVDAGTGALSLIPGLGFNGTLIDPKSADVVLRALANHSRSRVVSSPRLLVNDNATGVLESVSEVPFASVNASQTVATTSFAGFAVAGTTIRVTPHISEGDHLSLEFEVVVNDFTGAAANNLPPPRQTDSVSSEVVVPDGHTVIVGGLRRKRNTSDVSTIPIIENIPVINLLARDLEERSQYESLFVFVRPIILRDDKFKDLRHLSDVDHTEARIPNDFPQSLPVLIR